jgi:hypothetical protein
LNTLVTIRDEHGKPVTVCLTPDTARLMDGWLADRIPHAPEGDYKAIQRLRAELKPVYTPELAYAEWLS